MKFFIKIGRKPFLADDVGKYYTMDGKLIPHDSMHIFIEKWSKVMSLDFREDHPMIKKHSKLTGEELYHVLVEAYDSIEKHTQVSRNDAERTNKHSEDIVIPEVKKMQENSNKPGRPKVPVEEIEISVELKTKLKVYTATQLRTEVGMNHNSIKNRKGIIEYGAWMNQRFILERDIIDYFLTQLEHE